MDSDKYEEILNRAQLAPCLFLFLLLLVLTKLTAQMPIMRRTFSTTTTRRPGSTSETAQHQLPGGCLPGDVLLGNIPCPHANLCEWLI